MQRETNQNLFSMADNFEKLRKQIGMHVCKAKRIDNGEWIYGNLILTADAEEGWEAIIIPVINSNMFVETINPDTGSLGFERWYRVDQKTICHYVGKIYDEYIWENDVIETIYDGNANIYIVKWDESELDFKATNGEENYKDDFQYLTSCEEIKVLGNIFDNPELL